MRASVLHVYTALIPSHVRVRGVFPFSRSEEIASCASEKVQKEKFCVWKLLEFAIWQSFGKRMEEISFFKLENGKWACDFCHFSLSHSHNGVAVALSDSPVGVDIEKIAPMKNKASVAKKILTETEMEEYRRLAHSPDSENLFLLEMWTKKESLFKTGEYPKFLPHEIATSTENALTRKVCLGREEYLLSVAGKQLFCAEFIENSPYTL